MLLPSTVLRLLPSPPRLAKPDTAMFPTRLDSPLAYDIAKAMMDGFNRHYRLFRT